MHAAPRNFRGSSLMFESKSASVDRNASNSRSPASAPMGRSSRVKWPRAAGPFLAAVRLEGRLLVVLYQAAKGSSVCC